MEFIRILSPSEYDARRKRFRSNCFQNSSDGSGISIIEVDCILNSHRNYCEHISTFYEGLTESLIIFWIFDKKAIDKEYPENQIKIIQETTPSGDECHYNLNGLSNHKAKKIYKKICRLDDISICNDGDPSQLESTEQLEEALGL